MPTVSIVFDKQPGEPYYQETIDAVVHAIEAAGVDMTVSVTPTSQIDHDWIDRLPDAVVIGPGTPFARPEMAEAVIASARERGVPLVGT